MLRSTPTARSIENGFRSGVGGGHFHAHSDCSAARVSTATSPAVEQHSITAVGDEEALHRAASQGLSLVAIKSTFD